MKFLRNDKGVLVGAVGAVNSGYIPVIWAACETIGIGLIDPQGYLRDTAGISPDEAEQLGNALLMLARNKKDNPALSGVTQLTQFEDKLQDGI